LSCPSLRKYRCWIASYRQTFGTQQGSRQSLSRPIGAKVKQTTFATIKTTSVICSDSAIDSRIAEGTVRRWTNRAEWLTIHASNCQTMQSLTGTVYLIKNELTKFQYIGETLRPIQTRWDEHQSQKIESAGWFFNRAMREYEPTVWTFKELHIVQVDVLDASYLKAAKVHLKEELLKRELMEMNVRNPLRLYNMSKTNQFGCTDCFSRFGTTSGLSVHRWLEHSDDPWTDCAACQQRVLLAKKQSASERRHTGFGLWCSSCWLNFKYQFFQHKCLLCKECFLWREGLEKHMDRVHSYNLEDQQKLFYDRIFISGLPNRESTAKQRINHSKLWLECGRQVAGRIQPQCFDGVFYF